MHKNKSKSISVIIAAAGAGRRMRSIGSRSLLPINPEHSVLTKQVSVLRSVFPKCEIVLGVGYDAQSIYDSLPSGVKTVENPGFDDNSITKTISLSLRVITNNRVLIVAGDMVFCANAITSLCESGSAALIDSKQQIDDEKAGVIIDGDKITHIMYGLLPKFANIIYLTGKELKIFKEITHNPLHERWLLFEGINQVIENGGKIKAHESPKAKIVEINNVKDLEKCRKIK